MKRADVFKTQMILGLLLGLLVVGGASVSLSNQLGREVFMKRIYELQNCKRRKKKYV